VTSQKSSELLDQRLSFCTTHHRGYIALSSHLTSCLLKTHGNIFQNVLMAYRKLGEMTMLRPLFQLAIGLAIIVLSWGLMPVTALGCSIAETINPKTASAFELGIAAVEQHRYQTAITNFTQAIGQSDHVASAYSNRCLIYLQTQHFQAAIDDCTYAIEQDTNQTEAYLNRGMAQHQLGNYAAAIEDNSQLLKHQPHDFRAYFNRGLAQVALKQPQLALEDYENALENTENATFDVISTIYTEKGLTNFELQNFDVAVADLTQAIAWNQRNDRAYYNRGCVYAQQTSYRAALQDFDHALALDQYNADAYLNRGIAAYNLGQLAAAHEDLQQAAKSFLNQGKTAAYQQTLDLIAKLQTNQRTAVG
jgi:tetratricopeptide (TPR) repeat protein